MSSILIPATTRGGFAERDRLLYYPDFEMLYIHIPYCHHKCTYCGFYSVAGSRDREAYVEAVCRELSMRRTTKPLRTVYFGGGTPSLLSLQQLERIVDAIRAYFDTSKLEEVTIEANPENLTAPYLEGLAGLHFFDRLSIGIQSFSDNELRMLNRVHTAKQAMEAVHNAAVAGFDNISVDLIMGLPGQTEWGWQANLDTLASLSDVAAVKHLSCYELTVEEGSILERQLAMGRLKMPDETVVEREYGLLYAWCETNGFEQYEVSNFCRPGFRSRHNSRYWNRTPYIGIGASAHSFDGTIRRWNIADAVRYTSGAATGDIPFESEVLSERDAYNEYVMTALRTVEGIEKKMVPEPWRERLALAAKPYIANGLLTEDEECYKPTRSGLLHADGIAAAMFVL